MGLHNIKVKEMTMKETVDIIKRLDVNWVCTIDILTRIGETHRCKGCICKDTVSMGVCPIRLIGEFLVVR